MPEEPQNRPSNNKPSIPPMRFGRNVLGWLVCGSAIVLLLGVLYRGAPRDELSISKFWTYAENGQIKSLVVKNDRIEGELTANIPGRAKDSPARFYTLINLEANRDLGKRLEDTLKDKPTDWKYEPAPGWFEQVVPSILIYGLLIVAIWFLLIRRMGQAGGGAGFLGNFGRSRHRVLTKEHTNITFKDVAGIDEAKDEVAEIIEFLRNPRRFQRLGGRIPRGVLLVGEPGCGKTLLAKAIAGEADVPFFSISGSDFVEMFVGVGASRVRDLFRSAKESSPCIIFLDEIDAVGRKRGAGFNGGGHDEREQTLNAILVEMDGFDTNDQVIVIAATNRMDVLDPALTRPGRFDRQIQVPLPDIKGRVEILGIYAAKIKTGSDVDLQRIGRGTPMFSGADLAALINEAAIAATMANKPAVMQADLEEARDKVRWGRARKSHVIDEREKEITAYHEAGHALAQVMLPDADPLHKVSIIPRGVMGGSTFSLPEKDRHMYTRRWCEAYIRVGMAGRIAEEMFCGDITSGASGDIASATDVARKMVMEWGMSDKLSFVRYSPNQMHQAMLDLAGKEYSEHTAEVIDEEIKRIVDKAYQDVKILIESNRDKIKGLAEALLKYETLDAGEVDQILRGEKLDKPNMNDLLDRERAKPVTPARPAARPGVEHSPDAGTVPEAGSI